MPTLAEGNLHFSFASNWRISRYEKWKHFLHVRQPLGDSAVDIVAFRKAKNSPDLWFLEVKDFRILTGEPNAKNDRENLPGKVVRKAADTLAGLREAEDHAENHAERGFAAEAIRHSPVRLVLHLEPFRGPGKLFPEQPRRANVLQKMKQIIREEQIGLDPQPLVVDLTSSAKANVPWTVSEV